MIKLKSLDYLTSKKIKFKVIELPEVPKSAQDVERLYGCPLHQVLKTLVFIGTKPIVVTLPGDKKADTEKLKSVTKETSIRIAKPNEVKDATDYDVGGVTPFGITANIIKVIDASVFEIDLVNIGSGKAEIGIELKSSDLKNIWDGIIADITT